MTAATPDRSYRALLAVPYLGRILLAMTVGRIAGAMISIALVLFTLDEYDSPALAGLVTFASIAPGLIVSPIAGALLDRHGRARLVMLDYLIGAGSLGLIGVLALADTLPAWLLVLISAVASLTHPLSGTGLRSLFPIIVPEHLWERVNAVDSNAYVVSSLIGPPVAGAMVQIWGGPVAFITIGFLFAVAALILVGVRDPATQVSTTGKLFLDAWQGLQYAWRNLSISGIGVAMTAVNLGGGVVVIVLPFIVLGALNEGPAVVGLAWAVSGICGIATAIYFGRRDSFGRERRWFSLAILGYAASTADFPVRAGSRVDLRGHGDRRSHERAARHRDVHAAPAPNGPRVDGPRVRDLDVVQLCGLSDWVTDCRSVRGAGARADRGVRRRGLPRRGRRGLVPCPCRGRTDRRLDTRRARGGSRVARPIRSDSSAHPGDEPGSYALAFAIGYDAIPVSTLARDSVDGGLNKNSTHEDGRYRAVRSGDRLGIRAPFMQRCSSRAARYPARS